MKTILLILSLAVPAGAAVITTASGFGTLGTVATAAPTSDVIQANGAGALLLSVSGTLGTTAALCQQSGDNTNWTNLDATGHPSPGATAVAALGVVCVVANPVGYYRVNVSTCSSCSLAVKYWAARLN